MTFNLLNSLKKNIRNFTERPLVIVEDQFALKSLNQKIPPIVHQTWVENRFGKTHANQIKKFRSLNKNLNFKIYSEKQMIEYMEHKWSDHEIYNIFNKCKIGPLRTDIFRYCILYEQGGYYFDINKACSIPLTNLHKNNDSFVLTFEDTYSFIPPHKKTLHILKRPFNHCLQWGLCVEKKHKILDGIIAHIVKNYPFYKNKKFQNPKLAILNFTGPGAYTKIVREYIEKNGDKGIRQLDIKFNGKGIFKLKGSSFRYYQNPSYVYLENKVICN